MTSQNSPIAVAEAQTDWREIDYRTENGGQLTVSLQWAPATNTVRVVVNDKGTVLRFPVVGANALEAFHHPFVFAGRSDSVVIV